jgi:heme-degrading monooxygenase HmoA
MTGAVVRRWEATIARRDIARWIDTFRDRVFPAMRAIEGFLGIRILAGREGDPCLVTVLTSWRDMHAVRRFSGDDPGRAVLPDFMAPFFADADARATFHDELMVEAGQ